MITVEFITALFYEVDEQLRAIPKHPKAHLWPSEVVTLGLLHALKGVGNRAFYRWYCQLNTKYLHIGAVRRKLSLVSSFTTASIFATCAPSAFLTRKASVSDFSLS